LSRFSPSSVPSGHLLPPARRLSLSRSLLGVERLHLFPGVVEGLAAIVWQGAHELQLGEIFRLVDLAVEIVRRQFLHRSFIGRSRGAGCRGPGKIEGRI